MARKCSHVGCIAAVLLFAFLIFVPIYFRPYNGGEYAKFEFDRWNLTGQRRPQSKNVSEFYEGVTGGAHVLLNTYMRSGSTFMGSVLGYRKDTFYMYEPLWKRHTWQYLNKGQDDSGNPIHLLCNMRDLACNPEGGNLKASLDQLRNIFTCNLGNDKMLYNQGLTTRENWAGPNWGKYRQCAASHNDSYCWKKTEPVCRQASNIVMKVLRMDVIYTEILLKENPHLKVIQLFRDPRAVISSRIFASWYGRMTLGGRDAQYVSDNIAGLCNRMYGDILAAQYLIKEYTGRVKIIQYEDLIENTVHKVERLFAWTGMQYSTYYKEFLNKTYQRHRHKDPKMTASGLTYSSYRDRLPWDVVYLIQQKCAEVFRLLGYKPYPTKQQLRNVYFDEHTSPLPFQI